jgi:hypothetical protein
MNYVVWGNLIMTYVERDAEVDQLNSEGQSSGIKDVQTLGVAPIWLTLPDVVHRFKSFTTSQYRINVRQN